MKKEMDGVVTLTGNVSEKLYKSLAQQTVANLPGIKSVDNRLEVKHKAPIMYEDAWLITKVKSTLFFHRNINATEIDVFAKDGAVTLRGEATSMAQKELATEYAKDVEGVKNVNNEMNVLTTERNPDEKTIGEKMDAISESIDDASIIVMVKAALLYHRSTSVLNTTVETKEGVVKLGGKARNMAEKELASKLVSDVRGVKKVINKMIVKGIKSSTH